MARQRKLIGRAKLVQAQKMLKAGIPLTVVYRTLSFIDEWSYQSTLVILQADAEGLHEVTRPSWLQDEPLVQTPPKGWKFVGKFPIGEWVQHGKLINPR